MNVIWVTTMKTLFAVNAVNKIMLQETKQNKPNYAFNNKKLQLNVTMWKVPRQFVNAIL